MFQYLFHKINEYFLMFLDLKLNQNNKEIDIEYEEFPPFSKIYIKKKPNISFFQDNFESFKFFSKICLFLLFITIIFRFIIHIPDLPDPFDTNNASNYTEFDYLSNLDEIEFLSKNLTFNNTSIKNNKLINEYKPLFKPNLFQKEENSFQKECFQFIENDLKLNINNYKIGDCFDHKQYENMLSCHLKVAPSQAKSESRILVLGSTGKIGRIFVKKLIQRKIPFVEIKGKLHFDLNEQEIYRIFDQISFSKVYDLTKGSNKLHQKIFNYFNQRQIPLLRIVHLKDFDPNANFQQIVIPDDIEIFGNQYITNLTSNFYKEIYKCIVKDSCNINDFNNEKFYLANDIADILLSNINNMDTIFVNYPNISQYSAKVIYQAALNFNQFKRHDFDSQLLNKSINSLTKTFYDICFSQIEKENHPFISIFSIIKQNDRNELQNFYDFYNEIFQQYPDISMEFIHFWIISNEKESFNPYKYQINEKILKKLHVIKINEEILKIIENIIGNESIEYYLRNIGIRLSRGKMIYFSQTGNFPSKKIIEIVQKEIENPFIMFLKYSKPNSKIDEFNSDFINKYNEENIEDINDYLSIECLYKDIFNYVNGYSLTNYQNNNERILFMDLSTFKVSFNLFFLSNSDQIYNTNLKQNLKNDKLYYGLFLNFCKGFPSKTLNKNMRTNWGISLDYFNKSETDSFKQWIHYLYNITLKQNNSINCYVSTFNLYKKASRSQNCFEFY